MSNGKRNVKNKHTKVKARRKENRVEEKEEKMKIETLALWFIKLLRQ
jgi:hypothetical protein